MNNKIDKIKHFKGDELTNLWYSSGRSFDYNINTLQNAQAFTQVIWKNSREIGLGMSRRGKDIFMICFYFPAGNILDQIYENVFPPKDRNQKYFF